MTLERVPASRLRPGDVLYACDRKVEVADVFPGQLRVRVRLNADQGYETYRWFSVPHATHFKRVRQSHKIVMRPDLPKGTRGKVRTRRGAR